MAVDPSYTVRLAWHAHDLDTGGHLPADQVPYDNTVVRSHRDEREGGDRRGCRGNGRRRSTRERRLPRRYGIRRSIRGDRRRHDSRWRARRDMGQPDCRRDTLGLDARRDAGSSGGYGCHGALGPRRGHHERPQRDRRRHHGRRFLLHQHDRRRRAPRDRGGRHRRWRLGDNREGRGHDPDDGRDVVRLCRRGSDGHEHGRRGDGDGHCGGLTDCRADRCSRFCRSDPDDRRHHEPARTVVDRGRDGLSLPGRCVR
jgi:hypothetical protein